MQNLVEIRPAVPADIAAIAQLLNALNLAEGYDLTTDTAQLSTALFGDARDVALRALVAQKEGQVVGVLLYYPGYDTVSASYGYHLADMVVTPSLQQSGIGRMLMKALAAQVLSEQKEWVSLTVLKRNSAAQAFYRAMGMTQVEVDFFAIGKNALARL